MALYGWTVDADGNWSNGADWTPSGPPPAGSDVGIDTADLHTITYDGGTLAINDLTVGNDNFTLSAGILTVDGVATFDHALSVSGDATLQLAGGGSAAAASLSVDTNATLNFTGGTFSITAGGTVAGTGTITLTGGVLDFGAFSVSIADGFIQTYASLTGTGTFTLNGGAAFDYGDAVQSGAGKTVLTGTSYINSGAVDLDGGRLFENQGTLNWNGGNINLGDNPYATSLGGGTLQNDVGATFDITTDATATDGTISSGGGVNAVTNAGLFEKTAGSGTTVIEAPFTNTGTIEVDSGTLEFAGGFTDSGRIVGTGTVDITGSANIVGSDLQTGAGTTLFEGATAVSGIVQLDGGRILENKGVLTLSADTLYMGYNPNTASLGDATIQNDSGGTFNITADGDIIKEFGTVSFTNAGLLEKTATTGESVIGVSFTNTGTVSVAAGTLLFDAGGSSNADNFTVSDGAKLDIGGAYQTFNFTGGTITGGGLFAQTFGTITGSFTVAGAAELGGDSYYGDAEQTGSGTTLLKGATTVNGFLDIDGGHVLENQGTLTWTAGAIFVGYNPNATTIGGGTIQNDSGATFDIRADSSTGEFDGQLAKGSGTDLFTNAGLIEKTTNAGLAKIGIAFTNTGTISVQAGTLEFDGGGSSAAAAITVAAGATFAIGGGTSAFTFSGGTIGGAGNFAQTAGTLSGTVTIAGTATIGGTGVYSNAEQTGTGSTILQGTTTIDGYLDLDGGHILENQGNLTWTDGYIALGNNPNAASLGGGAIQNDFGATFDIQRDDRIYADGGTIAFTNAGTLSKTVTTGTTNIDPAFTNSGTISAQSGTLEFDGTFVNSGTATVASGATLAIDGATGVTGTGTLTIAGGVLTVLHGISADQAIDFSGTNGLLKLGDPASVHATISGFGTTDSIDLTGVSHAAGDQANLLAGNVLEITRAGGGTIDIQLSPTDDFTGKYFHLTSDGVTGSSITEDTAPCYCFGTLIRTDRGEIPVQDLAIGDRVMTLSGAARPIKWIGRRSYSQPFIGDSRDIVPILIKAGALGAGLPVGDLYVSPLHAMFIDNVLIPAGLLVNGVSILRCPRMDPVRYFHIELDSHDVIFAEGALAETFVDCDSRQMFHNAQEYDALYPEDRSAGWMFCAPRVEEGARLRRIWGAIATRAGVGAGMRNAAAGARLEGFLDPILGQTIQGWAWTPDHSEAPVELEILDGDGVIARTLADRYRADLAQAGIGTGRHHFSVTLNTPLAPWQPHEIHVRRVDDKAELPGSPIVIPAMSGLDILRDARFGASIETALRAAKSAQELDEALQLFLNEAERVRGLQIRQRASLSADMEMPAGEPRRLTPCRGRVSPLQGFIDRATHDIISGWVRDPTQPDERIALEILEGDIVIGRVTADRMREDVRKSGKGDGLCGFRLELDVPLAAWRGHEIHVRRQSDHSPIPGSPLMIGQPLPLAKPRQISRQSLGQRDAGMPPGKRILVIDENLPTPRRDGGSNAVLGHVRAFIAMGYRVEFIAARTVGDTAMGANPFADLDVIVHQAPMVTSVEYLLRHNGTDYDFVYLHRLCNAAAYAGLTRVLCPAARILYSVADLHHVRLARQAQIQERPDVLARARATKTAELLAMRQADLVITHSPAEANYLSREIPGVRLCVAPWPVPVSRSRTSLVRRRGIAFIGSYSHTPNPDAVLWLIQQIMPRVWRDNPDIHCSIVGHGWPAAMFAGADPRLRLFGPVDNLSDIFDKVRLTVAPLRFGAGIKGKVLDSLAAGIPCVMSPIAAEGIPLSRALQGLVGADAEAIARSIVGLYADDAGYKDVARAGKALIRRSFSLAATQTALQAALAPSTKTASIVKMAG